MSRNLPVFMFFLEFTLLKLNLTNADILFRFDANTKGHLHSHARFYFTSHRSPNAVKAPPVPPGFSISDFIGK